jgi:hypothetical protein
MKIACIGWGSIVWEKNGLTFSGPWEKDGPYLPIEFARQSDNGQLLLTICENSNRVQTFWTTFQTNDITEAVESLRAIENTYHENINTLIKNEQQDGDYIRKAINEWLNDKNIDAAVWSGVRPKFKNVEGRKPSLKDVIEYLKNLDRPAYDLAKEYFQVAPVQIQTEYRDRIRNSMKW